MINIIKYLIIFIIIFSCSPKDELLVDIDSFKKQGTEVFLTNKKEILKKIKKINSIENFEIVDTGYWYHNYYQSSNILPHTSHSGIFSSYKKKKIFSSVKNNNFEKKILVINNSIFYIDDLSNIYVLDLNFKLIKKFTLYKKKIFQDYLLKFSMVSDGENLFISDNLGNIHSYSPLLNKIIWSTKLGVPFVSNIILYKKNLYLINDNGKIFSFNTINGNQNWSYETSTNIIKNSNAFQVAADQDKLIFSNDLGEIFCIDLKVKNLIWSINLETNIISNISNNELLDMSIIQMKNNNIYFSSNRNYLLNINLENGQTKWISELPFSSNINSIITQKNIVNLTNDGFLSIFNKSDGSLIFRINLFENFKLSNKEKKEIEFKYMFIASNYIYAVSSNGFFFKINSSNLNEIYLENLSKSIKSFPIIVNEKMYFFDAKGFLYSF